MNSTFQYLSFPYNQKFKIYTYIFFGAISICSLIGLYMPFAVPHPFWHLSIININHLNAK